MTHGPIAELIRTRRLRAGAIEELDIVVCPADRESDLLRIRPDLRGWKRDATAGLDSNVVLYLLSSLPTSLLSPGVPGVANQQI